MLASGDAGEALAAGIMPMARTPVTSTWQQATLPVAPESTTLTHLFDIRPPCPVPIGCLKPRPIPLGSTAAPCQFGSFRRIWWLCVLAPATWHIVKTTSSEVNPTLSEISDDLLE